MTLPAEAWVLNFSGARDTLWRYSTNHLFFPQDHSDGSNFHHMLLSVAEIPYLPFKVTL
jgi:hypothetical protein